MRRSKSNPAKYARNYRKISQRKMTEQELDVEQEEIERMKSLLRTSSEHLSRHETDQDNKRSRNNKRRKLENDEVDDQKTEKEHCSIQLEDNNKNSMPEGDEIKYTTDETDIILPSKKKKLTKKKVVELTPEELKMAKSKHKALQRKLNQIEQRHEKKKKRAELYATISEHALSETEMMLMGKSADLGKRLSKKDVLKKLLQKERAGILLTEEEKDMLYTCTERSEEPLQKETINNADFVGLRTDINVNDKKINVDSDEVVPLAFSSTGKKKKKKSEKVKVPVETGEIENTKRIDDKPQGQESSARTLMDTDFKAKAAKPTTSFAAQMMAGLSTLMAKSSKHKAELEKERERELLELEKKRAEEEKQEREKRSIYAPPNPAILKSAAAMGMQPKEAALKNAWRVLPVHRPKEVESSRYDLPVSGMEYEIIDSIRNNSVTIVCSETGSGKSTQVPQFLYESGITLGNAKNVGEDDGLLICVTQPRRVAAVSTAKRVCYEMGFSNDKGQSIQGKKVEGNIVAYQTKYETAGLGSKTRIKFMTDGILLQEIKSDLLLRKYAVICLDEIHERGLNTDVLLGLLSAALVLRKRAAEEGSLPPLKLVLMSATLRIEDFTESKKLFAGDAPNVVKVPGRTFPVTIHHSKTTELDDYETVAFHKVCKIHRKLPKGGILVFLTGKQEIMRMVRRLRTALIPKSEVEPENKDEPDVHIDSSLKSALNYGPRDMDDDEADGDLYQNDDNLDDFEEYEQNSCSKLNDSTVNETEKIELDKTPKKVKILPLYSLLSVKDQAKVFDPVEEDTRLIVVATNIAETSLTIPGVSYVVDTGRQKCLNYHAGTGVASYDVMWISKASADQRAGRAGRTGPGHCYRIYSSSVYSRQLDPFALPEVLTRPLEDVVLAMKSMNIMNVAEFPFPTPPDKGQLDAAVQLLANIGCVDVTNVERDGGDGVITKLGAAVSQLPIGVRYGKMLLVAAQANVLDYGIAMVSVLSESSPFTHVSIEADEDTDNESENSLDGLDQIDKTNAIKQEIQRRKELSNLWKHDGGDVLAGVLACGAYSYAGRGAGGVSESLACRKFCEENNLHPVIMQRIHKMRIHLAKLAKTRLGNAQGVAATQGKVLAAMRPPKPKEENLLRQAIASGFLDNVARRSPQGRLAADGNPVPRSAYFSCRAAITEPLFIDKKSVLYSRDPRQLPEWVCYDSVVRKNTRDGSTISTMKNVTPVDPQWLGALSVGCKLLSLGDTLEIPPPKYDFDRDSIVCSVVTKFGDQGWLLPPIQIDISEALQRGSKNLMPDDPYRWFARSLLEGKIFDELRPLKSFLNDDPSIITRKKPSAKVGLIISSLSQRDIACAENLVKYWAISDNKFLFKDLKKWVKPDNADDAKSLWIDVVTKKVQQWKADNEGIS